jgi:large conductance mechanosensitive channel
MDPINRLATLEPAKRAFTLLDEFKNFAFKGKVIDLAIGIIIGAAFGNLVSSLVKNIIMPVLGILLPGNEGYKGWNWEINGMAIPYGLFLGDIVNFLIVSAALFLFAVKFLGWAMRERKAEAAAPLPPTKEQELLTEIRDLLRQRASTLPGPNFPIK